MIPAIDTGRQKEGGMRTRMPGLSALSTAMTLIGTTAYAGGLVESPFDRGDFSDPLTINNPYSPLVAGTTS